MLRQIACALTVGFVLHTSIASACSCASIGEFETKMPTIPLVFKGEVASVEILPPEGSPTWYGTPTSMRTTFNVKEVTKGNVRKDQQVYSQALPYSCGIDFARLVGRIVTIAAVEDGGKAFTGYCLFIHINVNREDPRARRRRGAASARE